MEDAGLVWTFVVILAKKPSRIGSWALNVPLNGKMVVTELIRLRVLLPNQHYMNYVQWNVQVFLYISEA